ncbi:glutamate-rich protein 6 [Girardinichthys multiradiatus]|uniref:glutamate-rich protein 6 n=1 Tax=Girardinichthys multiradiatus TaxID=208333 RepID=UPI001FAD0FAA|nr:glutamate-rich protein 6 [Girardinichthys multiradiatus]
MTENDKPAKERRGMFCQSKKIEDRNKFTTGLKSGLGTQLALRTGSNHTSHHMAETIAKILHFRLSCPPWDDCWKVHLGHTTEKPLMVKEDEPVSDAHWDHNPTQFGLCHYQGRGFLQKFYSSGLKFLNTFPDGSAQGYNYPSGLLAVIIVVIKQKGRVCIVYDDIGAPHQPVRAVFQSDGSAACYHNSGSIWLALNTSGGQCLNDAGAKMCQWSWRSRSKTSFHPIFLMLNQAIGVRVPGSQKVFVSFLSRGQQSKFSVGP